MTHAVLVKKENFKDELIKFVKCKYDGKSMILFEQEYSPVELETFNEEAKKWIIRCSGSQNFLSDTDGGEDAYGDYTNYFDLEPENAIFMDGKLIGLYLAPDDLSYSGTRRGNYSINSWGYPGETIKYFRWNKIHLFIFDDIKTHCFNDWTLLLRKEGQQYEESLSF